MACAPGTWRLEGGIGGGKSGKESCQVQVKFSGRVVGHGIERPGVIKDRRGDAELPVDKRPDTEEISDHGVDGGGLPEGPRDSGGVVAPGEGGTPGGGGVHKGEGGLLKDKGGKFEIRICDATCRVRKAD